MKLVMLKHFIMILRILLLIPLILLTPWLKWEGKSSMWANLISIEHWKVEYVKSTHLKNFSTAFPILMAQVTEQIVKRFVEYPIYVKNSTLKLKF